MSSDRQADTARALIAAGDGALSAAPPRRAKKRVMVSGCFDLLHSGHVAFLEEASTHGEVHVALGSDATIVQLKGRPPVNPQAERKYMLESLRCVHAVTISRGSGPLDFLPELDAIRPHLFFVNGDGDSPLKRQYIAARGVRYLVSKRLPPRGLSPRSTTQLRTLESVPYRLDLAGGWLDQPHVSKLHPGAVINCSIEPAAEFQSRSGLASSTRATAISLWGGQLPAGDREKQARTIFACENPPGTVAVSGSQDAIGIVYPGVNRLEYDGGYWPHTITPCLEPAVLAFLDRHVKLIPVGPRASGFDVLADANVTRDAAMQLALAADRLWDALLACDISALGAAMTAGFQ